MFFWILSKVPRRNTPSTSPSLSLQGARSSLHVYPGVRCFVLCFRDTMLFAPRSVNHMES